jgi:hypothetical protein
VTAVSVLVVTKESDTHIFLVDNGPMDKGFPSSVCSYPLNPPVRMLNTLKNIDAML